MRLLERARLSKHSASVGLALTVTITLVLLLIQFTVDELGRVVDPMIIEAEPVGVFDRSAMEAVQRFKYRPRVLYGQPMVVTGVKHRLSFVLAS